MEGARVRNLDIQWVEGSRNETLERLRNGEIDLMIGVTGTRDREASLDFGRGFANSCKTVFSRPLS